MAQIARSIEDRDDGYRYYSLDQIAKLIMKAEALGLDTSENSDLNKLTIEELETLVTTTN